MNIRNATYLLFSLCLSSATVLKAATLAVLPGESIQAQIDASSAGDIVAIFGGTYSEDITINKAIRLVEVSGQEVLLLGSVTFDGVSDAPPFEGFTVGSSGKDIIVKDTTGLLMRAIDHRSGDELEINGSSDNTTIVECSLRNFDTHAGVVELVDSTLSGYIYQRDNCDSLRITNVTVGGNISQSSGSLHTSNVTIAGEFNASTGALKTIAFRTTGASLAVLRSKKAWIAYSKFRDVQFSGIDSKYVIVGTEVDVNNEPRTALYLSGSGNKLRAYNCMFHNVYAYYNGQNYTQNQDYSAERVISIGGGNQVIIKNCLISMNMMGSIAPSNAHSGIYSESADLVILNNIFANCQAAINAPFGAVADFNFMQNGNSHTGGITPTNRVYGDPDYSFIDGVFTLAATSPCINAGSEDPRYNDRDGSRNDIGPSGGAWYDPDGWTTENPVVISFELSIDQILEGDATPLLLQEGLGVSIP